MRISKIQIYQLAIPFTRVVTHSLSERKVTEAILAVITDEGGRRGYGEGTPRSYVTGETLASSLDACGTMGTRLTGLSIRSAQKLKDLLNDFGSKQPATSHPSAWCALEIALLDLWSKSSRAPIWNFFAEGPVLQSFTYSGVIPMMPDRRSLLEVLQLAQAFNLSFLKLKIADCENGIEALKSAREYLGSEIDLRADANGALTVREAVRFIDMARPLGISAIEQPVAKNDLQGLTELTSQSEIPVIVDESLCTTEDAVTLIERRGCHGFNMRLSKCGGFQKSLELIKLAKANGILIQIGSHVGETAILSAAGRHLAALTPDHTYLEGSFSKFVLKEDIARDDISFEAGGRAPLLGGTGLGLDVNDSVIGKWGTLAWSNKGE